MWVYLQESSGTTAGTVDLGFNGRVIARNVVPADIATIASRIFPSNATVSSKSLKATAMSSVARTTTVTGSPTITKRK